MFLFLFFFLLPFFFSINAVHSRGFWIKRGKRGKQYTSDCAQLKLETMDVTSVVVPSVQELAKEPLSIVPERYVVPNQDAPIVSNASSLPRVPVIDLSKLLSQDLKGPELEKLHYACKEWGFFQVWHLHSPSPITILVLFGFLFLLSCHYFPSDGPYLNPRKMKFI